MQLPQKLIDKIISEHKDSPKELKACSLIGRSWVTQTRQPGYLFSTLSHMNDEQLSAFIRFFPCTALFPFTLPRGCVQKMSLEKPLHSYEFCGLLLTRASTSPHTRAPFILDVFGGIDTLDLHVIDAIDWMDFHSSTNPRARTLPIFTSLRTLNLRDVRFGSAEHFHDILNSISSLEVLCWQNARDSASPFLVASEKNFQVFPKHKLHTITICLHMFTPALTTLILRLCTQIHTWTLLELDRRDFKILGQLFAAAGARGVQKQAWTLRFRPGMDKRASHEDDKLEPLKVQAEKAIDLKKNRRVARLLLRGKLWLTLLPEYEHLPNVTFNNF